MGMRVFEFVIIKHPTKDEEEKGQSSKLIVGVQTVLAKDEQGAAMLAGRAIPEEELPFIDRLEVAVRPF